MEELKFKKPLPSEVEVKDEKRLETQKRVFHRWVSHKIKKVYESGLEEATEIFRKPDALMCLARQLAKSKPGSATYHPPEGCSDLENAVGLIDRLYGQDVASAVQLASNVITKSPTVSTLGQLSLALDVLWMLIVAAGAGTGPIEDVTNSMGSSTSTLTQRSGLGSIHVPDGMEITSARTPLLDRWLARQDERLLAWCQDVTQNFQCINITNFTSSWRDGLAFLAILHRQRPESFSYDERLEKPSSQNLGLAFYLASCEYGIPRLLETEDLDAELVDARAVAAYLTEVRAAVELERKRRSGSNYFELRTPAMEANAAAEGEFGATVTVATTSSRSSSPTCSEITFYDDETEQEEESADDQDQESLQQRMERLLAWMLSVEEKMTANLTAVEEVQKNGESTPIAETTEQEMTKVNFLHIRKQLETARNCFNVHEGLAGHMSRHQSSVSRCLRNGDRLCSQAQKAQRPANNTEGLNEAQTSSVDVAGLRKMLAFISKKWAELNKNSAATTKKLAEVLLRRQEDLLQAVQSHLEKLEIDKARQANEKFGTNIRQLRSQMTANRRLETNIEAGDELVTGLKDIVILIPAEKASKQQPQDKAVEGRIADLATRWGRLVDWVHTRYAQLQNALLYWRHFEEEAELLSDWLDERERETKKIEVAVSRIHPPASGNATKIFVTMDQTTQIVASDPVADAIAECLSHHESRWAQLLASLDRRARAVREACGDSAEVQRNVETRVDELVSRWSQLTEPHLDWDETTVGPQTAATDNLCAASAATATNTRMEDSKSAPASSSNPSMESDLNGKQQKTKVSEKPPVKPDDAEKRPSREHGRMSPVPTGYKAEFEASAERLLAWLDTSAVALELVTMKAANNQEEEGCSHPEQNIHEVYARISREIAAETQTKALVRSLGERYRQELSQAGENVDELDQLFDEIDDRWAQVENLLQETKCQASLAAASSSDNDENSSETIAVMNASTQESVHPTTAGITPPSETQAHTRTPMEVFKDWLATAENEVDTKIIDLNGNTLDDVISQFAQIAQSQPTAPVVEELCSNAESKEGEELRSRWVDVKRGLGARMKILHNLCENHDLLINQLDRFEKLMSDMLDYLNSVSKAQPSESSAIEAQLQESVEALRDMENMRPDLALMDVDANKLEEFFSPAYLQSVRQRITALRTEWDRISHMTEENINDLRGMLEIALANEAHLIETQTDDTEDSEEAGLPPGGDLTAEKPTLIVPVAKQEVLQSIPSTSVVTTGPAIDIQALEKWITKAKHSLTRFKVIPDEQTFEEFKKFLENMQKEIDSKKPTLAAMRSGSAADLNGEAVSDTSVLLFSGHFADLESQFFTESERMKAATYHINDFNSLLAYEKNWLDRVNATVRRSMQQVYIDVEAMADDISILENLEQEHSKDDFSRLQHLTKLLVGAQVMAQKITSDFERYEKAVGEAGDKIKERLEALKTMKDRTESTQARLDEYEAWLRETEDVIQQRLDNRISADSNPDEFDNWCSHVAAMDELIGTVKRILAKGEAPNGSSAVEDKRPVGSLAHRIKCLQIQCMNFKRLLLHYSYSVKCEDCLSQIHEDIQHFDSEANQLEIKALSTTELNTLIDECTGLKSQFQKTNENIEKMIKTVVTRKVRPDLQNCNKELEDEIRDLQSKSAKIEAHVGKFSEGVKKLLVLAERYAELVDPLEQVITNVEEVTDYLETVDSTDSHREMLQRVYAELNQVCGQTSSPPAEMVDKAEASQLTTSILQIEALISEYDQIVAEHGCIDGLNNCLMRIRRMIEKAFAARSAFRAHLLMLENPTPPTEVVVPSVQASNLQEKLRPPPLQVDESRPVAEPVTGGAAAPAPDNLDVSSGSLSAELTAFFEDIVGFTKNCPEVRTQVPSVGDSKEPPTLAGRPKTSILECTQKVRLFLDFSQYYFKQQAEYLHSRLNDLLNRTASMNPEETKTVMELQTMWNDSKEKLASQFEHLIGFSKLLETAGTALELYEKHPTDERKSECQILLTQLEETYNLDLETDRARIEQRALDESLAAKQKVVQALECESMPAALVSFRESLQQLATQLNEIQGELKSCYHIATHELLGCVQNLDQFFLLAQESASKTAELLKSCRLQHDQIVQNCVSNLDNINSREEQQTDRGEFQWLSALLETQNGRLETYCRRFHMCRPYWQEYATLWQTFTQEAVRQKHQIEMLQLNRLPSEQMSASSKRNEASIGTIRDHVVNLCSSALTLQRLGTKLVWKARHGELALGLNAVAYLEEVGSRHGDGRGGARKSLRHQETLDNDVEFVCLTFDAVVSDLCNLAKSHKIESFLPPNLKIDVTNLANELHSEIGIGEDNEVQETTFPQAKRESAVSVEVSVTDVEACMDRLGEEIDWLREHGLLIPLNNTQAHYATQRDSEFWCGAAFNERSPAPLMAPWLCSSWVRKKSQELSKLDAALKLHENRTAQLCHISEELSSTCEDPRMRDQLREAADELHISMETARGIVNRRRTRLSTWQSTCATFESALLMNAEGEEVEGDQTLPVWIATIRQRLQQSKPDLSCPDFQKELDMLRREFDPHGTGTGHTLETVENTLEAQLVEEERQSVAVVCQGQPQLNERVVRNIKTSLEDWHTVCRLLKLHRTTPVNGEDATGDSQAWPTGMSSSEVANSIQLGIETALNKLSFWLDTVRAFIESNKASLGGHFDQETVLARLKQATASRKDTNYAVKSLYPTAIQMQLQQYTLELEARKPQLDRLEEEARRTGQDGRLTGANEAESSRLGSMVEDVRENWNAVGQQVKDRLDQLEKIIAATDELKTLERDLDRWMSRTETELASALGLFSDPSVSAAERKSAIQDIISHLPEGEAKFNAHQQKCEHILTTYSKEDTQKIRTDQSTIQRRWSQLVMRLRDALEGNVQVDSDFIEIPISPRTGSRVNATYQSKMSQPTALPHGNQHPLNTADTVYPVVARSLETSVHPDNNVQRQGSFKQREDMGYPRVAPSNSQHAAMGEPMDSSFREGRVDNRITERSPNFNASPSARIPTDSWPLFLAQLRQLNDWLSHRDAAFQQLKGPIGGTSKNVSQRLARHTALEDEVAVYRSQIEDTIEKGQFFLRDQLSESQSGSYGGSEEESDSSEFDQNGFTGDNEDTRIATKRIARRIRRHLNYLTRRWMELNKNMLAYRLQLNRAVQKLAFFEQILDEAEMKLADAQKLLASSAQTGPSTLARDEKTVQMIWDISASVAHAITSLDGQALQLSDDGTIISHALISRLDALKIQLEKLRSETTENLGSVMDMSSSRGKIQLLCSQEQTNSLRAPPRLTVVSPPEASNGGNQAPIQRPISPADCWLQAFKTVPPPWERCLHPSGSQVPYYKNHATQETQWDHPAMLELLQRLDEDNEIRFTAYRTAAKFRKLQQFTFFDQLPLNVVTETFARHGLALPICGEGCDGRMMDVTQIVNCLTTLYCRVWDILAGNPDVVKVVATTPNHTGPGKPPLLHNDSATSKDITTTLEPTRDQDSPTASETKTLTRHHSQKKALNCVPGALCRSSKKTDHYNEFTAKPLPPSAKQQQHKSSSSTLNEDDTTTNNPPSSTNHPATRQSDQPASPGAEFSPWVADGSHSRVQKLHTSLRLPDGRLFSLPTCVDLALNLLLNAFDSSRNGSIRVLSFKVAILLLLDASLEDKYQYIFSLVANRDNELDESRLWLLIYECMQLPRQLGEGITSSSLEPTVRSCFKKSLTSLRSGAPAEGLVERGEELLPTIRMDRFYDWLKLEPQALAWLPALYRLIVAGSVVHPAKCSVCQTHPLVGLRYRCLRCLNFDLCQRCFLVGRVCKSHKITHPIKEYASGSTDTFKDFTLIVRNRLRSKDRFRKQNSNPEEVTSTPPPVPGRNSPWRNTWTPNAQHTYVSQSPQPPMLPIDQVCLNGTALATPQINRSTKGGDLAAGRPTFIGDGRRKRDAGTPVNRQRAARQYTADVLSPSADQEHELIAKYSQSLRRQSTPNLVASVGMQSQFSPRESALPRDPTYPTSAYDPYSNQPGVGWLGGGGGGGGGGGAMTWDRHTGNLFASRPPPPPGAPVDAAGVYHTGRENQLVRSLSYRASSQPPSMPMGGSDQASYGGGQGLPERMPVLPRYRQAASVAGSAGSLDRVLHNLEEENRFLRAEYERLRLRSPSQGLRPLRSPSLQPQQQQQPPHAIYPPGDERFQNYPTSPNRAYIQGSSVGGFPMPSGYGQPMQQMLLLPNQMDRGPASGLLYGGSLGRASTAHVGTRGWERSTFELGRLPPNACYVSQDPALGYEMVNEARLLRQHKSRLESRMQLLEDHNRQLEDQLSRLRQYLNINTLAPPSRPLLVPENTPLRGPEHQSFNPLQQDLASCIPAGMNYGQINQ